MNDGVRLDLMIGPVVPIPAPQVVMDALTGVEVTTTDTGPTLFQLTFTLANRSPLHTLFLLAGGGPVLFLRVIVTVTVNGTPTVLADGVITDHQVAPGGDEGHSSLVVTGEDVTVLMDQQDWSGLPFPALPAEGRVALLLAKYAVYGVVPLIVPSVLVDVPIPTSATPSQQGTDLAYIRALADRVGYVFHVEPGPVPGANIAYWGPRIKVGVPQPALNADFDADRNVTSLSFRFDSTRNKIPTVFIYNELTKVVIPIPIPPITPLNPPLGLVPPLPTSIGDLQPVADNLSKLPIPQAVMIGLAKAADYADAVTGEGTLDVVRYGRVLRARQLVGVRGAGPAYDGLHYVTRVTHSLRRGSYTQRFALSRNGLLSTVPEVVP
ncbi:hypothetical protein E8D34_04970 [Nocardioides sp. GY 10113]|uniref:hypothetical protein n=1 Tax=Nocardioides sp. GY 10113 TaxID=2569761 RepID=UPI0010A7834A|nr:hypothetical protein [Nocardioides sp. GY 10113]TIC88294.1 hypothetical protein E8D34_04970 [Nocardioides sp. GY 10113]